MQSPSSRIEDDADIRAALEWFQQVTEDRSDLLQRMRAAEPRNLAGDLRESVVLSCASWCQLQRAPLGKWLNIHVTLSQLPLIMPGSRVRVPPFPPIRSACYRSDPRLPTRRKRTVSAESRPPSVLDQEIQVFGAALISAHHSEVEIVGPVRNRPRDLSFPPTLPPLN